MSFRLPELGSDPLAPFPPVEQALIDPNGLLAWGGGLEPARLLRAYAQGIFPWFSPGEPPLWWSPAPRMVVDTGCLHLSRRFRRELRQRDWQVTADRDFDAVIGLCSRLPRRGQNGTWIVPAMRRAYTELHRLGHAHSIEAWAGGCLIGGLYGVSIGRVFFGESMFSLETGASKCVIGALCRRLHDWGFPLLDGQVESPHLASLGFGPMARSDFLERLRTWTALPGRSGSWSQEFGVMTASELAD